MANIRAKSAPSPAPASGDYLYVVDVSDTTDNAQGSDKADTIANVVQNGHGLSDGSRVVVSGGVLSSNSTDLPVADGGTGASDAAGAKTNLGFITDVVDDTTPQLGGSLDVNGNKIVSTANGNIDIEPNGTGNVLLGNITIDADQTVGAGQDNYVLKYDNGTGLVSLEAEAAGGISNVVEDTTPQLGGQLDVNGNAIGDGTRELLTFTEDASAVNQVNIENEATGSGPIISAAGDDTNIDLNIVAKGTGNVKVGNFTFDGDATVGSGQDNYVLTYDNGAGTIGLEAAAGGSSTAKHQIGLVKMGMDMIGEGVVTTESSGTGASVSFATTQGINLSNGTTGTGYARMYLYKNRNNTGEVYGVFDRNPNFHSLMALYGADDAEIYLGFGSDSSWKITSAAKGFGFKIVIAAGVATVYAVNSNGTSTTETDITTAAAATSGWTVAGTGYTQLLNAVMTSGTDIKFYINGTLMATHTTNLPSGDLTFTTSNYLFACSNYSTTGNTSSSQLWIRDHYVDIDVV